MQWCESILNILKIIIDQNIENSLILELVVKLAHIYGLGEIKRPLPTYTFMRK